MTAPLLRRIVCLELAFSLTVVMAAVPSSLHAQNRTLEIDDLRLEVDLATPVLSPDGSQAIVRVSTPNYDDNRIEWTLILIDIATGAQRELTPHRRGAAQPRWSPSGDRLAFTDAGKADDSGEDDDSDEDGEGGGSQVFVLPMGGGEARQVTHAKEGVEDYEWTADGKHILYTSREPAVKLEGEERHNRSFEVGDHSYLTQQASRSAHLWRIQVEGGVADKLTEGAHNIGSFVVSPDGATLALEVWPSPHTADEYKNSVRLFDLESGETRHLLGGFYVESRSSRPTGPTWRSAGPAVRRRTFTPPGSS